MKVPKVVFLSMYRRVGQRRLKCANKIILFSVLLLFYFTSISPLNKEAKADYFYPNGNLGECKFSSTIAVGYDNLGGGGIDWNNNHVSGYSRSWVDNARFTDVATPWTPDAHRYTTASSVAVPPNTRVSVAFYVWNYSGHWVNVDNIHLFNSRHGSNGGVTRLGAGGNFTTTCIDPLGCRSGRRVVTGSVGGYAHHGNEDGRIIYSFETIQPITGVDLTSTPIWEGENLRVQYNLTLRNNSSYDLCNIRIRDTMPSGAVYDQDYCINAGQTRTIAYYDDMGNTYPLSIVNDGVNIYDNNWHTEDTAEAMTWSGDNRVETKTTIPFRDDDPSGSLAGWNSPQPSWGMQGGELYEVTLIPYNFSSGEARLDLDQNVEISKTVSDSNETEVTHNTAENREEITYKVTVTNNHARVDNMRVIDDYDENYLTILDTDGGMDDDDRIAWTVSLQRGESRTFVIRARINNLEQGDHIFINNVWTEMPNTNPVEVTTNVKPEVVISVEKFVSDSDEEVVKSHIVEWSYYLAEEVLHFDIYYSNTGDADAHNTVLTDDLRLFDLEGVIKQVENISGGGLYDSSTKVITWNLDDLERGESGQQSFNLELQRTVGEKKTIDNLVEIGSDQTTPLRDRTITNILPYKPPTTMVMVQTVSTEGKLTQGSILGATTLANTGGLMIPYRVSVAYFLFVSGLILIIRKRKYVGNN